MEHLPGGEFFNYLVHKDTLRESEAQFYIANILSALRHLHDQHITYRDLKPENLVFDAFGYVKLVDFGFAKILRNGAKTFTVGWHLANCF